MGRGLITFLTLAALGVAGSKDARAIPIPMDVNSTYTNFMELDSSHEGLERRFDYQVKNNGNPSNVIGTYKKEAMKQFEISADDNLNVYRVEGPSGWYFDTVNSRDNKIVMKTTDISKYIQPGQFANFFVYTSLPGVDELGGVANAYPWVGSSYETNQVDVPKQVLEPSTVALLGMGCALLARKNTKSKKKSI